MRSTTTTILLVDDNETFRRATRALLEVEHDLAIVGEAADGKSAVTLARQLAPAVVLMDIGLPDKNGFETTRQLLATQPDCCVVVLSLRDDPDAHRQARTAGAAGYVTKLKVNLDLTATIRAVAAGGTLMDPGPPGCRN